MSYQVLARKWRPRTFAELVGQEHVARALVNGLDNDRLHHAFLFTGTRGVGKTTIARIFAKALNCEEGVSSEPCGKCPICLEVDDGRFVDLIEVDAASRTKVDDTRELLDNVQYAPGRGRYKVYLIDEVHMLSTHSFNALLKTLEEPPPHVKFLLATTDPQKLPVTVLSRCLQFNLKRLETEQIRTYLARVLEAEAIDADAEAIAAVAAGADGSMRDALSLLDQAIAFGGGALRDEEVRSMLGTIDREHVERLLDALAASDGEALWAAIGALAEYAPNFGAVLRDLAATLHEAAIAQVIPKTAPGDFVRDLAGRLSPEDIQLAYEIAVQARASLDLAPDPRSGFEMAMLRMLAFRPSGAATDAPAPGGSEATAGQGAGAGDARAQARELARTGVREEPPVANRDAVPPVAPEPLAEPPAAPVSLAEPPAAAPPSAPPRSNDTAAAARAEARRLATGEAPVRAASAAPAVVTPDPDRANHASGVEGTATPALEAPRPSLASLPEDEETLDAPPAGVAPTDWNHLFTRLGLRGTAAVLAANSVLETRPDGAWQLSVDPEQSHLRTEAAEERIREAIRRLFGQDARVEFVASSSHVESPAARQSREAEERVDHARHAVENDPFVARLRSELGATLIVESIRPLDN
ncbi:MAG: DNA polymerase III subunit gamma/tau [Pseudomonadota bacterium]